MPDLRKDRRNRDPQGEHRRAFMAGWTKAVNGELHVSIGEKKTHANMGNLFGWIFGPKPDDFRRDIWDLYQKNALDIEEE